MLYAGTPLEPTAPKLEQFVGLGNQQVTEAMMWNEDRAYFYGVLLGDGFYEQSPKCGSPYVMLKVCDKDFLEYWADVVSRLADKKYAVALAAKPSGNKRAIWYSKCYFRPLVREAFEATLDKTQIPYAILQADAEVKKAFLQGLMDSEAWIRVGLYSLKQCTVELCFGQTDKWIHDIHKMFPEVGVKVSKLYKRTFLDDGTYAKKRKDFYSFRIDILDYVDNGMRFNIERKQRRLDYAVRLLRDYTHDYPRYD